LIGAWHTVALLSAYRIGSIDLRNRVVMAPMTRNRAGAGELATPMMATYYAQRAGAGLIVTEASQVAAEAVGYPKTPGIHNDAQIAAWRQVTDAVHEAGGRIFLQLWHAGRTSHPSLLPEGRVPVAPSAIAAAGNAFTSRGLLPFPVPRALALAEIVPIVAQFGHASLCARAAGFDGVEIHAGNGYLIDQFLRDGTNRRTDRYGGSPANRARFLLEVTEAVAAAWEAHRVGVRISPLQSFNDMRDSDPAGTFSHVAKELSRFDLAYLHVVESIDPAAGNLGLVISPLVRKRFDGPLMLNGGYTRDLANFAILDGLADLVSFGSAYIANPDLTERFRHHHPLNTPDRATFYGGTAEGYIDYPVIGDEPTLLRA
jgi:N-ethylmaleimide reductase